MFPFRKLDFTRLPDKFSSSEDYSKILEVGNFARPTQVYSKEEWGDSGIILNQNSTLHHEEQPLSGVVGFDDLSVRLLSPYQLCRDECIKHSNIQSEISNILSAKKTVTSSASYEIVENPRSKCSQRSSEKLNETSCSEVSDLVLSTTEIVWLAGEKFIQSRSLGLYDCLELDLSTSTFSSGPDNKERDVEVIQHLLASAEKVDEQKFDRAIMLFNQCDEYASAEGNPIQRLVYYFTKALRARIALEIGKSTSKNMGKMKSVDIKGVQFPNPTSLAINKHAPFSQVVHFTGVQAILEAVTKAKRIHIVDLEIGIGVQYSSLIQALASRHEYPVEHLKITAVGTKSKSEIEKTGVWLKTFAVSMNLSFSFNVVMVSDMLDLDASLFELNSNESIAVYLPFFLWTMIFQQDRLEHLMKVVRSISPCVVFVAENEANINSTVFVKRFTEALFYYGAYFDCLENCLSDDPAARTILESIYYGRAIENILMAEKKERMTRHVKVNVWKTFFTRFDMVQIELSTYSLYQARLVTKNIASDQSSCSLHMDGKSLIVGWKGTPLISLSVWKFM